MEPERTPRSRAVLVVGATSGIGLAVARRLADDGARLAVCARDAGRVGAVVAELRDRGAPLVHGVVADVAERGGAGAAVADAARALDGLDAVVLTAQVMAYGTIEEVDESAFEAICNTALRGTFGVARAALPLFRARGGGSLVVVSSLLAEIAVPSMSSYCTAKWGQLGMVRSLQAETRHDRDVHVSLVLPGAVDTPIYEQAGTWAGRGGHAPPPVVAPVRVAEACVRLLERPRRLAHVGPVNRLAVLGFRLTPSLYDVLAPVLVRRVVLRGPGRGTHPGNVHAPRPEREGERGGWTAWGRRRGRADRSPRTR